MRITFAFLKNLLKRKLVLFLLVLAILYKLVFNSFTGEFLIKKGFQVTSTGSISLDVKRFSLLFGIIINDILILSGEDFDKKPILKLDRLAVTYNLPLLFAGRLKLTEISLTKPEIHLWQRNGKWNAETLFVASEEKKEEEKKEEPTESSNELSLPIPVSAYMNFFIHDLKLEIEAEKGEKYYYAFLDNFSFYFLLNTKRFSTLPFSPKAVSIIDELTIQLNPTDQISITMKDNTSSIKTDLKLALLLQNDNTGKVPVLNSSLNIGSDHIPIKMKTGNISPFSFQISYDLNYIPEEDKVDLKNLLIAFAENKFLEAKGEVKDALKENPEIHFEVLESLIDLDKIERVTDSIPVLPVMNLKGFFSLKPFTVNGKLDNLKIDSGIHGKNIIVELFGAIHNLPKLDFDLDALLDLQTKEVSSDTNILPILKKLNIQNLEGQYNGIIMKIKGEISPKEKVDLHLDLDKVIIEKFVPTLIGKAHLFIHVTGEKLSLLNIDLKSALQGLRYKLGRGISGINQVDLNLKTTLDFKKDFQLETLNIEPLVLTIKNENKETGMKLVSHLDVDMRNGIIAKLDKLKVELNITNLIPTIPVALRTTIGGLRNSLGNLLTLTGNTNYKEDKTKKQIQLGLHASLPALELPDLSIGSLIEIAKDEKETLTIDNITLSAFENKFKGLFKGNFYKPRTAHPPLGEYAGELNGNLTLESDIFRYVLKGTSFKGDLDIDIHVKDNLIKGALRSSDSSIVYKTSECPKKGCQTYEVNGIKMNIPFLHDINDKTTEELIDGNKTNFIKTYGQDAAPNITIISVTGTHPSLENAKLDFIKPVGDNPGFSARIDYIENNLTIDNLKAHSMNGLIYGKDILFNIGNGDPEKIEYTAVLQVRDIDLAELLPKEMRKKIDDGKIKLDLNISGQNLNDPIGNLELFFSTFYIGEDFGKSAIRIVSPENWMTDRIINSYRVDKIEIELTKGLVYAVIKFQKSIFNTLVFNVENDMISQERIPLASFLKRTENELSAYK
ncbi:MAG: hypothetical protein KBF93_09910 [Leptospiraceae bacterium]|nr:hypothetical protein [Leptospiraceae bacterium]